ncbi:MAG: cellulase family glycosylhydrolase [Oscillospiraceae bacterium]|nr:cellulase family glycosylhydrolase [Oscillospiraceae bacterium]
MKYSFLKKVILPGTICASLLFNIISGVCSVDADAAPDSYHDDWLHVNENAKIVDMNGNPVWLTGCNWFGFNVGSQVFDGVWSQNMHEMLTQIADHGFNLLRVPMSTEILLQWKNGDPDPAVPKVNEYVNPELTIEGVEGGTVKYSFDIWNQAVEWCRELGIKIMIDIHCAETASAGHQVSLWYTDKFSTEDWCTALEWFADYYKDDDTILAIDLKNEPHGTADTPNIMAKWDNSTDPTNWKYAAETCAARVLAKNPELLIMVEGTEVYPKFEEGADWSSQNIDYSRYPYSYYHHTWWGGNFRGAKDYPIDLGEHQSQLVYSPHDYGPLVFEQDWFYEGFTQETLLKDCWYDNWYFIQDTGMAPLLMGEWGGFMDGDRNEAWMIYLRDFMIENRIHHTFWCFNENSGDTGGLVYDNFGKWDEEKYALVKPSLWQDEKGRFISLDHTIKLGANGITVTEYYGGTVQDPDNGIKPGDVNKDGKVNILDLSAAKYKLCNEERTTSLVSSPEDTNGDGTFNIKDILHLAKYIAGINVKLKLYNS